MSSVHHPDRRTLGFAASLVLAVGLLYSKSLYAPFLFDDAGAVLGNPTIRDLTSWQVLQPPADGSTTTGRPLVNLSFALNYALSGVAVWSYHALNILLHAAAALVLFGVIRRTVELTEPRIIEHERATWIAFSAALLWALHPLQTESVVCIAQRTELLCGLFYLLTLYGFIRGAQSSTVSRRWLVVSVLSCALGMAAKEVMATAPLLVLLYDRTFVVRGFAVALRLRRGFYAALGAAWLPLAWLVSLNAGSRGASAGFGLGISSWDYLLTQAKALVLYLKLCVWPHPLVLDYGTAVVRSPFEVLPQGFLVLGLLTLTVWAFVRRPKAGFVGAAAFLILAPSSSVIPLVTQTIAEHRMYLPLAALGGAAGFLAYQAFGHNARWLVGGLALGCAMLSFARQHDYRTADAIWSDTVAKAPQNARAHNNLALVRQEQGHRNEANAHYARAVELQPNYVSVRYNWGVGLLGEGRLADAIAQFEAALRLAPEHADARVNLGNALTRAGRPAEAIPHYEAALTRGPAADVHYNLGVALMAVDRTDDAAEHFQKALRDEPRLAEARFQLGRLSERARRGADAESHYRAVLTVAPEHIGAHARLGLLLARTERHDEAATHFQTVIRLEPNNAAAHANLGNIRLLQSRPREALASYEEALRLRPDDPRTRENIQLAREALR